IKVSQVPLNRYAYYLTPQGFAEKGRLTAEYLSVSFNFFRRARGDCVALLQQCSERGWRRVALYGAGERAATAVRAALGERTAARRAGLLRLGAEPAGGVTHADWRAVGCRSAGDRA